ncbi:type II toxin-antitoxin system ParD family antitoxin [Elstera sp.]|jgi:antitoxin ParD1/3/4|uniref:type II toxin-antitoxin system ParD family antitoxin n=1 Tax=Elstera sp. TaxID=1916664 RepID=UPI0037C00D5B
MSTLNISMPEAMREYIETQATRGNYSASEYVRHLIREDQKRQSEDERKLLWEYLALCAQQLDEGDTVEITADEVLARGRARRQRIAS